MAVLLTHGNRAHPSFKFKEIIAKGLVYVKLGYERNQLFAGDDYFVYFIPFIFLRSVIYVAL